MKAITITKMRRSAGYRRRNFTLQTDTARRLDRLPREVNRSRLVNTAINQFLKERGRAQLRKQIEEEAIYNSERDLRMVNEWFGLEEEAWDIAERAPRARK